MKTIRVVILAIILSLLCTVNSSAACKFKVCEEGCAYKLQSCLDRINSAIRQCQPRCQNACSGYDSVYWGQCVGNCMTSCANNLYAYKIDCYAYYDVCATSCKKYCK